MWPRGLSDEARGRLWLTPDCLPPVTIDPARLEMIAEVMAGGEPLGEFLDVFLANTAERINQIRRLLDSHDLDGTGREAHTLLGTAG